MLKSTFRRRYTHSTYSVVSLALRLAALLAGIGFAGYHTLFGRYLGMNVLSDKSFCHVVQLALYM